MSSDHKLAAILFADIAGYTAMMQKNERDALQMLSRFKNVLGEHTSKHHGKIVQYFGDGCLLSFDSSSASVDCAIELQKAFSEAPLLPVRMGLHLGDVIFRDENAYGDGVNVASRIESLSIPGAVLMSKSIRDQIKNHGEYRLISVGTFDFKNVEEPIEVFALANPGLVVPKREEMKGKLKQPKKRISPFVWILSILLIGIAAFLIPYFTADDEPDSIAVLSFAGENPDQDQENLGDGFAISIINSLARLKDLKVLGHTTSFSVKGKNLDAVTIGKTFKTKYLLEGKLQGIGNDLAINISLINARDGSIKWSHGYHSKTINPLNVQDDVAQAVAKETNLSLTNDEKKLLASSVPTTSLNSNDYFKGLGLLYKLTRPAMDSAFIYFQRVLDRDPKFAHGHAAMAALWGIRVQQGQTDFSEARTMAEAAAKRAIELNPLLADAHYSLGLMAWLQWDWNTLEKEFNNAIRLSPNHALAHIYFSQFLWILGRPHEADFHSRQARERDPSDPLITALYSMNLMYAGKVDEAVRSFENNLKQSPNDMQSITMLRTAYHLAGRFEDAYKIWKQYFKLNGDNTSDSVMTAGNREGGYLKALQRLAEYYVSKSRRPWTIATLYTRAGMKDEAFVWLNKALIDQDPNMPYLKVDPIFEFLRQDPRYKELLRKLNLPVE